LKNRTIFILCFTGLFLFVGAIFVTDYVNSTAYHNVLDPARAAILGNLARNNVEIIYGPPDWDNLRGMTIMTTEYYKAFKSRCLWENASSVYHTQSTALFNGATFYVIVPQYHQVWEYGIHITAEKIPWTPFYRYTWTNPIS